MNRRLLFFQLLLTLFILGFIESNGLKVCLLLPLWWISFGRLSKNELIVFVIVNVVFAMSDIAAIRSGFFQFARPDLWGLPYYEFFMWGFYLIHTHRFLQVKYPTALDFKVLILAVVLSALFGLITDRELLLLGTAGIFLLGFIFYHEKEDVLFSFYMMGIGVAFEFVGIERGLWSYPEKDYLAASLQFVVMWGAAGLFLRRIVGPWLAQASPRARHIYQPRHLPLHHALDALWVEAQRLGSAGFRAQAWDYYQKIETTCRDSVLPLNYQFCVEAAELATSMGYARKGIELYRKALKFVTTPPERAAVYLGICRLYRIMIRMKNARYELKQAFRVLDIEYPRASMGALLRSLFQFTGSFVGSPRATAKDERRRLEIRVGLYEEAGLSAYYYVEYVPLIQCALIPRALAYRLGPSLQMIDWLGGSGCVLSLLGIRKAANSFLDRADRVSQRLAQQHPVAKALLWRALAQDYDGDPVGSAQSFSRLFSEYHNHLTPHDLHLASTTLAVNLLQRGQMGESSRIIESMFAGAAALDSTIFSCTRTFIDWYRIPALSFLGRDGELRDIIQRSKAIFSNIDEEKWQVTQFLGVLLIYYYTQQDKPLEEIEICLHRFKSLGLTPRTTCREACYYWVAKAYILIDLFHAGQVSERRARRALSELARTPAHPSLLAHQNLLSAKLKRCKNPDANVHANLSRALGLAEKYDNDWVKFEVYMLQSREHALDLARGKGWEHWVRRLERSAA